MKKDHFDQIEDFLDGSMNDREREEFENLLNTDPEIRKSFEERKKLQEFYTTSYRINELKTKIAAAVSNEKTSSKNVWLRNNYRTIAAAAVILAIAVFGSIMIFDNRSLEDLQQIAISTPSDSVVGKSAEDMANYANKDKVTGTGTFDEFFPDEFSRLSTNDSICFKWPATIPSKFLLLYDSKGMLVKKIKIRKKAKEYWMMPGTLKEGTYFWKFMHDTTLIRITVTEKP
jgi:hypothetical protein